MELACCNAAWLSCDGFLVVWRISSGNYESGAKKILLDE